MKTRPFAKLGRVPLVGQGTWQVEQGDRAATVAALRRGLELGLAHVDTAELYGAGLAEEVVAEAIAGRRDEVFLVSKVMPDHATYAGTRKSCEQSIRRLKTDRLDVYLLHWPGSHPLAETVRAFESLVQEGKIRAWGVSNFDLEELEELMTLTTPDRVACNQVLYHLGARDIERSVLPWCVSKGIPIVGYSPFGAGDFPEPRTKGGRALDAIAKRHGATARQVALNFLVRLEGTFTIPKAAKVRHVEDNAGALKFELTTLDLAQLDAAFPAPAKAGPLPVI